MYIQHATELDSVWVVVLSYFDGMLVYFAGKVLCIWHIGFIQGKLTATDSIE